MNNTSKTLKINATIPENLLIYLDTYQKTHQLRSRSAALSKAIQALRELELQRGYKELGEAQQTNLTMYPPDTLNGIDLEDTSKWH
jgi:metal-responsive CopG/Arc/MetJ family transcriptional regulator